MVRALDPLSPVETMTSVGSCHPEIREYGNRRTDSRVYVEFHQETVQSRKGDAIGNFAVSFTGNEKAGYFFGSAAETFRQYSVN